MKWSPQSIRRGFIGAVLTLAASTAQAAVLLPTGEAVTPDLLTTAAGTLQRQGGMNAILGDAFCRNCGNLHGSYTVAVVKPSHQYLDFYYQFQSSAPSADYVLEALNGTFLSQYDVQVFYRTESGGLGGFSDPANPSTGLIDHGVPASAQWVTPDNGGSTPANVSLTSHVDFNFTNNGSRTDFPGRNTCNSGSPCPAMNSTILVIRTNASGYIDPRITQTSGQSTLVGSFGDIVSMSTFAPTGAPMPEPGSIMLFGTGLFALAGAARRKFGRTLA